MSSPSTHPKQRQEPRPVMHPIAQAGMTACFGCIAGSAVIGGIAYTRGNTKLYNSMVRARMVLAATGLGLYCTASGWLQPPAFLTAWVGREPRLQPSKLQ